MKGQLLDINLLVALFWPAHTQHKTAIDWFVGNRSKGWVTCPFTQAGFIRIVSNPAFSRDAVAPLEAAQILKRNMEAKDHAFWPDDQSVAEAIQIFQGRLTGHQQVTDAYLFSLAIRRRGVMVTFDRSLCSLVEQAFEYGKHLAILEE